MLLRLLLLLISLLLFSGFLTPPIYTALDFFMDDVWPFSRVYDRVALVVLIVLVYMQRKQFALGELNQELGLWKENKKLKKFMIGLTLSLLPVLIALPIMVDSGVLEWKDRDLSYYAGKMFKLSLTIIVVSLLEELVFRTFVFWKLKQRIGLYLGALVSALIYSGVHFITPVKKFAYESFDLFAGFEYYIVVVKNLLDFQLLSAFIVLAVIGFFLALVYARTKSLFFIMGLHGGWIASLKLVKYSTHLTAANPSNKAVERYYLLTQPETWLAVALTLVCTAIFLYLAKDLMSQTSQSINN